MPAIGSTALRDPWPWKKKMMSARRVLATASAMSPFQKGSCSQETLPKYNGSVKPKDWLIDYSTAVRIANGNRRVAVKYVPLMLQGTARHTLG